MIGKKKYYNTITITITQGINMLAGSYLINLLKSKKVGQDKFNFINGRINKNIMQFTNKEESKFNEILNKVLNEQDGSFALNYLPDDLVLERCLRILDILKFKNDEQSIQYYKFILKVLEKLRPILNNRL